jgi:carboxylesterase
MEGCEPFLTVGNNGIGIIFQHGSTGTPASMIYAAQYFKNKGYTVLAPALAGHATCVSDLSRCTVDDFRTALESAIDLLNSCCDKVILCGLSMGGMLSAIVGSYMPIEGLVLMAAPSPRFSTTGKVRDCGSKSPEENGWYRPDLMRNWKTYGMDEMMKALPKNFMEDFIRTEEECIPNISVPTCLIYSKGDKVCSIENGYNIFNALTVSDKHLNILEKSGHVLTADGERDKVFRMIENFAERITAVQRS